MRESGLDQDNADALERIARALERIEALLEQPTEAKGNGKHSHKK